MEKEIVKNSSKNKEKNLVCSNENNRVCLEFVIGLAVSKFSCERIGLIECMCRSVATEWTHYQQPARVWQFVVVGRVTDFTLTKYVILKARCVRAQPLL